MYNTGSAAPVIVNSIFCAYWSNRIFTEPTATCTVTYSCVSGGHTGAGNIDADPLFVDLSNGDVRLLSGSPCIDTGTASGAPADDITGVTRPQGAGFDMGAHEFVNAAPVIDQGDGPLAVTMSENGAPIPWIAPALSASDADTTDVLTWTLLTPASHGMAVVSGTGASPTEFSYAPDANWYGIDSVEVQVSDGTNTDSIEIIVTVEFVPDPVEGEGEIEGEGEGEGETENEDEGETEGEGENEGETEGEEVCIDYPDCILQPLYITGQDLCLMVPCSVSPADSFQWLKDGVPIADTIRISGIHARRLETLALTVEDSGHYTCSYDDGSKTVRIYDAGIVVVVEEEQTPVASLLGLSLLLILLALAGIRAQRYYLKYTAKEIE